MSGGRGGSRLRGWRGLGWFWLIVLVGAAGVGITLQVLGPPPAPARAAPVAPAEAPPPAPTRAPDEIAPPVAALLEPSKLFAGAMLPKLGPGGRAPRAAYARAQAADPAGRPRIAILVVGLGMSASDSRSAIETLPGPVSLAFSPYAASADPLLAASRRAGHEMLVSIPMEPQGYPLNDAGTRSLLTGATAEQNAQNLEWTLSRMQGYVGAVGAVDGMRGERFADQTSGLRAVLDELKRRGLLYVDPRPGRAADVLPQVPGRAIDLVIDDPPARAEIEAKLAGLERIAREKGSAIGLAGPLRPVTIERIAAWSKTLSDRGMTLVPVSALVDRPASDAANGAAQ